MNGALINTSAFLNEATDLFLHNGVGNCTGSIGGGLDISGWVGGARGGPGCLELLYVKEALTSNQKDIGGISFQV